MTFDEWKAEYYKGITDVKEAFDCGARAAVIAFFESMTDFGITYNQADSVFKKWAELANGAEFEDF